MLSCVSMMSAGKDVHQTKYIVTFVFCPGAERASSMGSAVYVGGIFQGLRLILHMSRV